MKKTSIKSEHCLHCGEKWPCEIKPEKNYYCLECGAGHYSNKQGKMTLHAEQPDCVNEYRKQTTHTK